MKSMERASGMKALVESIELSPISMNIAITNKNLNILPICFRENLRK